MENFDAFKKSIWIMCVALVGQSVVINWRAPIVIGFAGQAYIDEKGVITFDIDPNRSAEGIYTAAVHEVAHCIAGHLDEMPPRNMPKDLESLYFQKGPILERTLQEKAEYDDDPREVEARNIANELDHYAQRRSLEAFGNNDIQNRIAILSQVSILRSKEKSHGEEDTRTNR